MKALLICPDERREVAALSETAPLSNVPILGKTLLEYWIEQLVSRGAREILVLATDRPEQVRALVGDGCRWGIRVTVFPEIRELTIAEARRRYRNSDTGPWLNAPADVVLIDHLPGRAEFPLFTSYADWFAALANKLPRAATPDRLGVREIKPGVWVGWHTRIAPDAELRAPCWIGAEVFVGNEAVIGPMAILEQGAFVASGVEVAHSVVGPKTFVGANTELRHSLACGDTLINWTLNSVIKISETFLLASLAPKRSAFQPVGLLSRLTALLAMLLTAPLAVGVLLRARICGWPTLRPLLAVRPRPCGSPPVTGDTLVYYEFTNTRSWLRRWPQLWSIVRGQFAWVGNRPLSPQQAARLTNDFERLWLTTRLGLLCLADTESGCDVRAEEARAHASYYAAHADWWLDGKIFLQAVFLFACGVSLSRVREACGRWMQLPRVIKGELK
jgi:hypothetical protein